MNKFLHGIGYISAFTLGSLAHGDNVNTGMVGFIAVIVFLVITTLTEDKPNASVS